MEMEMGNGNGNGKWKWEMEMGNAAYHTRHFETLLRGEWTVWPVA